MSMIDGPVVDWIGGIKRDNFVEEAYTWRQGDSVKISADYVDDTCQPQGNKHSMPFTSSTEIYLKNCIMGWQDEVSKVRR